MVGLSGIFYFTDGTTNPFVWFLLRPLIIAATLLPTPNTQPSGNALAEMNHAICCLFATFSPIPTPYIECAGKALIYKHKIVDTAFSECSVSETLEESAKYSGASDATIEEI